MKSRKIVTILLLIIFIILSILVCLGKTEGFDNFVYKMVTSHMSDFWTTFYKCFTFLGSTPFVVFLCVFFVILVSLILKKKWGYFVTIAVIIEVIFNNVIKIIIRRERPEVLKLVTENTYSYPSGHTCAAVMVYGMLIYVIWKCNINKKIKIISSIILGIIPFMVAISRIYLGAHFATDILGAFLMSTILIMVITYVIDKNEWL